MNYIQNSVMHPVIFVGSLRGDAAGWVRNPCFFTATSPRLCSQQENEVTILLWNTGVPRTNPCSARKQSGKRREDADSSFQSNRHGCIACQARLCTTIGRMSLIICSVSSQLAHHARIAKQGTTQVLTFPTITGLNLVLFPHKGSSAKRRDKNKYVKENGHPNTCQSDPQ